MDNTSCKGYWVQLVYVGDFGHPDTYKCMNQQEYDAYTQQIAKEQYGDGGALPVLVGLGLPLAIVGIVVLSFFVFPKIRNLRRSKKA